MLHASHLEGLTWGEAIADDVHYDTETGETYVVLTDDPFDRLFVDGEQVGYAEQGSWHVYAPDARVFNSQAEMVAWFMKQLSYNKPTLRDNEGPSLDPSTVGKNFGLSYPGPFNPMTYPDKNGNRWPDYTTVPISLVEYPAIGHDRRYDNLKISGFWGLVSDTRAIGADWEFVKEQFQIAAGTADPATGAQAVFFGTVLGVIALPKTIVGLWSPQGLGNAKTWYNISSRGVTNAPSKPGK